MSEMVLRPAGSDDAALLWEWANDPSVRANAFRGDPIPWESHLRWLEGKLASRDCRMWILEVDGGPAGQIRYDRDGATAIISFSVDRTRRGQGIGKALISRSAALACRELGVRVLAGLVKPGNPASSRVFEATGFTRVGDVPVEGQAAVRYERPCPDGARA